MDGVFDKGYANYYAGMAITLEESGHDVSQFYAAAYEFDPSMDHLNLLLAQHNSAGHYQTGLSTIDATSQAVKEQPAIMSWKAWFLNKTEAYDAAIDTYAKLFSTDHRSDEDVLTYVQLLEEKQRWKEAYEVMHKQVDHMSRRSTGLGKLLKFAGFDQQPEAVGHTLQLLQNEKRIDLDNIYDVLDGLYEVKQIETLMKLLDEQLVLYPDHVGLNFYKGDIHFVNGEHEQALAAMERAHQLSPDNERIEQYLKDIQLNMGLGNYQLVSQPIEAVSKPTAFINAVSQLKYGHPDSDAEYLYYAVGYDFNPGKPLSTSHYRKLRINNSTGVERFKTLTFEFDQSHEDVYLNELKVFAEDGQLLQEIDRKTIYLTNNPDGITADDDMVINIPVPQIRPGVELEFVITTQSKGNKTEIPYSKHFFAASNPIAFETVFIAGDITGIDSVSRDPMTEHHTDQLLMWSTTATREMVFHSMMPQLEDISNWLIIGPAGQTWESIGQEYLTMIADKVNTDISRARKLAIFGDARSDEDKILKAAQYIQQKINYQALEFGTRALIPNTAQQTLENGYGDCKDHAVLLTDLLNAAGIRAQLALVQTRRAVHEGIPALDQFNHAVVYLPDHHGGMFIDTTDKELSIGAAFPPENLQGSKALILDPEQPRLSEVPRGQAKDNTIVVDRELKKSLDYIEITDTIMMTGYKASGMRYSLKNNASNELQQNVQSWIAESYSELELLSFEYYGLDNNQEPLIMELKTRIKADQSSATLPFFIEKNYLDLNHSNQRKDNYEVNSPFVFTSTTSVTPAFQIDLPQQEQVGLAHPATEWQITSQPGKLSFKAENRWYQGTPESYNAYVTTMKKAIKQLEQSIQLEQ